MTDQEIVNLLTNNFQKLIPECRKNIEELEENIQNIEDNKDVFVPIVKRIASLVKSLNALETCTQMFSSKFEFTESVDIHKIIGERVSVYNTGKTGKSKKKNKNALPKERHSVCVKYFVKKDTVDEDEPMTEEFYHSSMIFDNCLPCFSMLPTQLIDNAIKYNLPGRLINVDVEVTEYSKIFSITNFGPRVELEEIDTIFENEVRSQNAIQVTTNGQGIGLFLAKVIANWHNADLEISIGDSVEVYQGVEYSEFTISYIEKIGGDRGSIGSILLETDAEREFNIANLYIHELKRLLDGSTRVITLIFNYTDTRRKELDPVSLDIIANLYKLIMDSYVYIYQVSYFMYPARVTLIMESEAQPLPLDLLLNKYSRSVFAKYDINDSGVMEPTLWYPLAGRLFAYGFFSFLFKTMNDQRDELQITYDEKSIDFYTADGFDVSKYEYYEEIPSICELKNADLEKYEYTFFSNIIDYHGRTIRQSATVISI